MATREVTPLRKMIGARSDLIMTQYFFGPLAARMKMVEDPSAKKMWTDMKQMGYNPEWVKTASLDEIKARMVEIVMHNANGHSWRGQGRDHRDWNVAADYSLWSILREAGFALPDDVYYDSQYKGLSAEAIYSRIHHKPPPQNQQPQNQQSPGQGGQPDPNQPGEQPDDDPGSGGEVRPAPMEEEQRLRDDWKIAVLQAAQVAKQRGQLPSGLEALIEDIKNPQVDWKAALRRFIEETARNDYRWQRPSRRHISRGMYLPELRSHQAPPFGLLWDTSGSLYSKEQQAEIAAEVAEIFYEVQPEKFWVFYIDAKVQRVDVFEPGDKIEYHVKGGGGTDFRPLFDHIEKEQIEIACLIGISDLYAMFPDSAPDYPMIWAATTDAPAPFGEVLRIKR